MLGLKRLLLSQYLVLLSVVYLVVLAPFTPGFASPENLANLLTTLLPLFLVAIGQTIVLITGGIDLSVTSIIALTSITGAAISNTEGGWGQSSGSVPMAIMAMLLLGGGVGLLNGLAISKLKMPPFIVTLTSMMFFSGLAIWLTQSKNIGNLPSAFNAIGGKLWIALPVTALLAWAAHLMLRGSLWGRWIYAVGRNRRAAFISGIPVDVVTTSAYMLSGFFAAAASVLYTSQAESGSPVLAQKLLLDIVGATVLGGTSLFGGRGNLMWTLWGVLFLRLIDNSLNLLDLSYFSIMMVKGAVILFAAALDALRSGVRAEA